MKGKKKIILGIAIIAVIAIVIVCLYPRNHQSGGNFSTLSEKGKATVAATGNDIKVSLSKIGDSGTAQVYAYGANEYTKDDRIRGISSSVKSKGTLVGDYKCGQSKTLSFKRYSNKGQDRLYDKYYVEQDGRTLYGPVYATKVQSERKNVKFAQKSIKGLFNENLNNVDRAKDLKANSITLNIDLGSLCYANEDAKGKKLNHPADAIPFKSNGKTYYFNRANVAGIDAAVIPASKAHMNVIAVAAAWKNNDPSIYASSLRYNSPKSTVTMGTNTSNAKGRDYLIAMMEFLADRYSKSVNTGLIGTYVVSNEIDFTHYFYDCKNLNTFMEEYSRTLRLTNLAVKKYASDIDVALPFTHYFRGNQAKLGKECPGYSFTPYDMLQWLVKYSNARGAYDWAIAPHCYGTLNGDSNMAATDTKFGWMSGNYKTSKIITFSNFEVWKQYLSLKNVRFDHKMRSVYLTESGASSNHGTKKKLDEQAATLAQSYYKVANMPFVKSFNYYRLLDNEGETKAGLACGLLDTKGKEKPAYKVYKYIDSKKSLKYTNPYLKYIDYKKNGQTEVNKANGKIKNWKDAMTVYSSSFNWNHEWNMHNVYAK